MMDGLKEMLFSTTMGEFDELVWMMEHGNSAEEIEIQRARFKTAYCIIERADLENEYEAWCKIKRGEEIA